MHWLDPQRWDLGQKIAAAVGAALSGIVSSFGIRAAYRAWQDERTARAAAAAKAQADALIDAQRQAAIMVAQETKAQLEASYQMGQRHLMDALTAIQEQTQGLHTWKGEHTVSDDEQFRDVKKGQAHTHETLGSIIATLKELGGDMRTIQKQADRTANDVEWLIRERGGKQS